MLKKIVKAIEKNVKANFTNATIVNIEDQTYGKFIVYI